MNKPAKTLITGALPLGIGEFRELEKLGLQVVYHQDEQTAVANPDEYEIIICNALFQYQPIEHFTNLKLVQLTSAGYDRVPLDDIEFRGIRLFNAGGVYSAPMAEFALCGVLQLYKQSRFFEQNQQRHLWEKHRGLLELTDKLVCIVGAGSVGIEVAKRFAAFGAHVTGIDLYPKDTAYFNAVLNLDSLDEVLKTSDIVVLTLPLSDATRHLFDGARLSRIKPGAILVNSARGAIVEETALIDSLRSGRLSGAVLDVFEQEPLPADSPLWEMDNVILTPHNSFVGENNARRLFNVTLQNLQAHVKERDD